MAMQDDDLRLFEAHGAPPLATAESGYVVHDGVRIWYSIFGSGPPVILLHGGLGHSGNWGYQVPFLIENGFRAVVIDSRGHGRSTRDHRPYSYELMASDVVAVMDELQIEKALLVGWSDGACIAMVLGATLPSRVAGVFFFACNMDPTGTKPFEATPVLERCFARHKKDYAALSPTPDSFQSLVTDLTLMQRTEPNYSEESLGMIRVPVTVVQSQHDEFIRREHAEHLARSIPNARFLLLDGVSHFAPLQRPQQFNTAILEFLCGTRSLPKLRNGEPSCLC
jgi:pimeloyl-ACP methyl ester carboxylesterase